MHWAGKIILAMLVLRMAAAPFSAEEVALAQIIQGEAGHEFMGGMAGAYAVGWVARNRLETGEYGETYQALEGFDGRLNTDPKWRYVVIARLAMSAERDPTGGALYVLSQQDMDELTFDEEAATLVIRASERRALLFFVEWPGEGK